MIEDQYYFDFLESIKNIPNVEKIKNNSILISGANGLIPSSIVDFFIILNHKFNYDIRIKLIVRDLNKTKNAFPEWFIEKNIEFYETDVRSISINLNDIDYVINAASIASPNVYIDYPVDTIMTNIIGSFNMLNVSKKNKVKKYVYISSSEVYGPNQNDEYFDEKSYNAIDILNIRSCYPLSKILAENLCVSFNKQFGVDTVIVRPGHIYGPNIQKSDKRAASAFLRSGIEDDVIEMKSLGLQKRSYCYVVDCVSAILCAMLNGQNGEAYNIADDINEISIRDFANTVSRISNKKLIISNPNEKEKKSFNVMPNSVLIGNKIKKLGWKAIFDVDHGVKSTLERMTKRR